MTDRPGTCQGCGISSHEEFCTSCDIDTEAEEVEKKRQCSVCEDYELADEEIICPDC